MSKPQKSPEAARCEKHLREFSAWAIRELAAETATCPPQEILERWREYGLLVVKAERKYFEALGAWKRATEDGDA
ncbi:hypothetical protein [Nocardia wallacei]|uniref:hypothetical protein n=1 Tax=Nocardia wallacei TaxID=480035 RepID=UPI002453D3A0|nr:hypothetical protein [Nocardia wallacei]